MAVLTPRQLSLEHFKQWLKRIDTDGDGRISKKELVEALRGQGFWFKHWRAGKALAHVDKNCNGLVDGEYEFCELLQYVQKHWGLTFAS